MRVRRAVGNFVFGDRREFFGIQFQHQQLSVGNQYQQHRFQIQNGGIRSLATGTLPADFATGCFEAKHVADLLVR